MDHASSKVSIQGLRAPRTLLADVETAPNLGFIWGKWEQNVIDFQTQWYLLCFAYKWQGENKVHTVALPDFPLYKKDREDDRQLTEALWKLFDEADIVVAHNGDSFDIKKANARFIHHRLPPPSAYKSFDTLKAARKVMANNSNKLDDLGRDYDLGRKLPHTGFHLWHGCMLGDKKAWALMRKYNAQDIVLLEKFYNLIRPWANHPNVNIYSRENGCPKCGSHSLQQRGVRYTRTSESHRLWCKDCGAWSYSQPELLAKRVTIR